MDEAGQVTAHKKAMYDAVVLYRDVMNADASRPPNTRPRRHRIHAAAHGRWVGLLACVCLLLTAGCAGTGHDLSWRLNTAAQGHLPDLAFQLTDGNGRAATGKEFRGKIVLLYFGYTHCPDVCPLTLTHLHQVMQQLGPLAENVRILFVSVDPARDTPQVMHEYVTAFGKHIVGLTGTEQQIRTVAKRYRVAFSRGAVNGHGGYAVSHSSAIYIFDRKGQARLLATPENSVADITHDVRQLVTGKNAS